MVTNSIKIFRGAIVSTPEFGELVIDDCVLAASAQAEGGQIVELAPGQQEAHVCQRYGIKCDDVVRLKVQP